MVEQQQEGVVLECNRCKKRYGPQQIFEANKSRDEAKCTCGYDEFAMFNTQTGQYIEVCREGGNE